MAFGDDMNEGFAEGEEPLHFLYNREERLSHAPKNVQDFYAGGGRPVKGLFKALVSNKTNRFMLIAVVFSVALVLFFAAFGAKPNVKAVSGFEAELNAFSYSDTIYASVKIHPLKSNTSKEIKDAEINFVMINADEQTVFTHQENQKCSNNEIITRTSCKDYDIIRVEASVNIANENVILKAKIVKRE